ncbi:phosphatases II [Pholiota conissans]|uniref:Phosphatases II n=1 Tax=Pholiota conissans TaxID=109636 RepID=A0A9P5Z158_9AGAR|nr:phosphatases II [Pholiota conissans]
MTITTMIPAPDITEILKGQLYLGNLQNALSVEQKAKHSITHVVSVCSEFPSTGPKHLNIAVEDTEYDDLLIHLPRACAFIQHALERGGRVLVHCVMGISRSSTVVAAFLMKTTHISHTAAIQQLKAARPQVHPNYGFIKQLEVFAKCNFEPFPAHPQYRSWMRRHRQDVTQYLNHMADIVDIVPEKLYLTSEFPTDPQQAQSLLPGLGITHLLSISPAEVPSSVAAVADHMRVSVDDSVDAMVLALPGICSYIRTAIKSGGLVLVYSSVESRACVAACAYLMSSQRCSVQRAVSTIENALPLFHRTQRFTQVLEIYHACGCNPTPTHPALKGPASQSQSPQKRGGTSHDLRRTAASLLSETGIDLASFSEALNAIQGKSKSVISVR